MRLTRLTLPVYLLLIAAVLVFLLLGSALAQEALPGLPASIPLEFQGVVTLVIGLISAWLVQPATAIAKKLGRTTGPSTVGISAALSLLVAFGFAYAQARAGQAGLNVLGALTVALIAFVKSNGDYLVRVFASGKALSDAAVIGALPTPGADGSPQTNGNEGAASALQDQLGAAVQPLFGGGLGGLAALGMSQGVQDTLVTMLTQALNAGLPTSQIGPFLARLIGLLPVLPDLLDGSPYLSQASRARISGLLSDLRIEAGL